MYVGFSYCKEALFPVVQMENFLKWRNLKKIHFINAKKEKKMKTKLVQKMYS